jgi:ATP-independent RNA helicase DbpA
VGTPGRIQDHLRRQTLDLKEVKTLVLDEADRMLDMGFYDEIMDIISHVPIKRQTLLFSATYPNAIKKMCRSVLNDPVTVVVESEHKSDVIQQLFYQVKPKDRDRALLALFEHHKPESALVFCHTRAQCDDMAYFLRECDIDALAIHGDLDQRERDEVLTRFSNKSCSVLVATDVAARGLDIKSLQAVINFELPRDPEIYVHRIGRTGRAGEKGLALSLFTEQESRRLQAIEAYQDGSCETVDISSLDADEGFQLQATMVTLQLDAGKKNKLRPGDLLGALTKDGGIPGKVIGKIDILDRITYVAIDRSAWKDVLAYLANGKVKGRKIRARKI